MAARMTNGVDSADSASWTNWAGNVEFTARSLHSPESVPELQEIVAGNDRVRALGSGHSFNRIADTPGALVRLGRLPRTVEVDAGRRTARVSAGLRLGELCAEIRRHGLALPNLPSTPHFTLAGTYATGTHGSGDANGTLATAVRAVELVTADGGLTSLSRGSGDFDGVVTSLGALGVVTALTLDLVPAFEVEQYVHEGLAWPVLVEGFDDLFSAAYSVSAFTDWAGDTCRLWVKRRTGDPLPDLAWTGACPADGPRHPIEGMPAANATEQLGVPGPWDERLPHFRAGFMPSTGAELQSEYFVARADAAEALKALAGLRSWIAPVLQVSEIRTIAADTYWLSPSHGRDSVAFHFTWIPDTPAVAPVLARMEEALAPFDARPHWGKLSFTAPETLAASYGRWDDFRALLGRLDPTGTFRNELIDHWFPA
jgi:xylitol oxidase